MIFCVSFVNYEYFLLSKLLISKKKVMQFQDKHLNDYKDEINIHFIILKSIDWIGPSNMSFRSKIF